MCLLLLINLSACDQFRDKLSVVFRDKTPQQINLEASQALAAGQPLKVIELTKSFVDKPSQADPEMIMTTAKAYAQLGDVNQMIPLLDMLVRTQSVDKTQLFVNESFAPVRTDMRFVSWLASVSSNSYSSPAPSAATAPTPNNSNAGVSAEIGPNGISARAGGVSVKISD